MGSDMGKPPRVYNLLSIGNVARGGGLGRAPGGSGDRVREVSMDLMRRLRDRRTEADEYSSEHDVDPWGTRIVWFVLSEGVKTGRRMASKYNKTSNAWKAYLNLVKAGLVVEEPEWGIVYEEMPCWESEEGTMLWFEALVGVAAGCPPPPHLPRRSV